MKTGTEQTVELFCGSKSFSQIAGALVPVRARIHGCGVGVDLRNTVILRGQNLLVVRNAERLSRMERPVRIIQHSAREED